jgi:hypothetical protein
MELKIRIKEVKEEMRKLTIEERCMHSVVTNPTFKDAYRDEVSRHLDKIGFVERVYDGNVTGLFRKTTIRDATPEEIIAWHCRSVWDICSKTECLGVFEHIRHLPVTDEWVKAKELLEGKEVILSLTEESI